jgi:Pentapeptide repeats (8 copies)
MACGLRVGAFMNRPLTSTISSRSKYWTEGSVSDSSEDGTTGPNPWRDGEKDLRRAEVELQREGVELQRDGVKLQRHGTENQRKATRTQLFTAVAAVVAAGAAVWISVNAREAINVAKDSVERQAEENRIATAVGGLQGDGPVAQRIAALTLLQRQAVQKLESANESGATDTERRDALNFFRSTLKTLEGYVRDPVGFTRPDPWGTGNAEPPRDVHTAGLDIERMLRYRDLFNDVRGDRGDLSEFDREPPHLDLSFTSLYGVGVGGIDMSWLKPGDFHDIDLRRAIFDESRWHGTKLQGAHLECAAFAHAHFDKTDLSGADMRRADLRDADLRGANLDSVNLEGANLEGAKVARANFRGANLDSGVTAKLNVQKKVKGLTADPDQPTDLETQFPPDCDEQWWTAAKR